MSVTVAEMDGELREFPSAVRGASAKNLLHP